MHRVRPWGYLIAVALAVGRPQAFLRQHVEMFYQLVHNSQLARQQSTLSSKNQPPNPTIVRFMSPFKVSRPGQTCSLVPAVCQVSVSPCLLGQKGASQQHSAGRVRWGGLGPGPVGQDAGSRSWRWAGAARGPAGEARAWWPGRGLGRGGAAGRELGPVVVTRLCSTSRGLRRVRVASVPE